MSKDFSNLVGKALGRASVAWSKIPSGIFDSDTCSALHIDIMNAHNKEIKKLQAENAKLRECVEFYANEWERGELDGELLVRRSYSYDPFVEVHYNARKVLKELEER